MRISDFRILAALVLALIALSVPLAFAQGTSASLTGQVTDSSGAALPGATVKVVNSATNLVQTATTNAEGVYTIAPLPPGQYTLNVEVSGFRRYIQSGIVLTTNLAATQNVLLQPGRVEESVTVEANVELINTTSAELGTTVNQFAVTQLPLNGRDPSSLVFLAPGVTNVLNSNGALQAGFSFPTETGGSANGGRQGSTYYLLDGVPNMDNYLQLTAPFPNSDATQEFRVITNNFDARYGYSPGAVVSIETKSGTNSFHGGAFEFLRNQDLNAANWFTKAVDPLRRNQFGAYFGGPILKNKLFFFTNYQGTRLSSASTANLVYTPTAAMLNGDFSGISQTLGAPFATVGGKPNQVDPALFSPAAVAIATTALPLGQGADGSVYYTGATTKNNLDEGTAKLDYILSDRQRLSVRAFINYLKQPSGDIPGNILSVLNLNPWSMVMGEDMEYYNGTLSHTWEINPTTVNVASVFWTQMSAHNGAAVKDNAGQNVCFSRYINVTELPGECYIEGFNVYGGGSGGFGTGWTEPSQEVRTTYGLYDNFSKNLGRHLLTVGANLQHQFAEELTQYPTQPIITFNGQYTGYGLADFLLGDLYQYQQGAGEIADVAGWQPGFYGQDQFKLRPNLTLTFGLRWDPNIAAKVAGGRGAAFIPGEQSTQFPNAPTGLVFPGDPGVTAGLMPNSYNYWQPRIGVAWQPHSMPHTSFRAGFGLFQSPLMYSMYNHSADIAPFSPYYNLFGSASTPLSFQDPWAGFASTGGTSAFPPFASIGYKPPSSTTFATPISVPAIFSNDFRLGTTQSWNFSVEQELGHQMAFHLAYVGSQSYHQSTIIDQNPGIYAAGGARTTYPSFGQILTDFSNGTASYHALQASIERRFSHGFQFQSNFTWSKGIDDTSSGNISFGNNQIGDPFNLGWSRGISDLNFPLRWVTNFIYVSPALGNNQFVKQTLGGWEISAIITSQSGNPFSIEGGTNASGANIGLDRADVVSGQAFDVRKGSRSQWMQEYFNTGAFTVNAPGTFGDSGRNIFQGPPINAADVALAKNWTFTENYKLQFRWEMFNALNHPNFGTPVNTVGWGNFGQITSMGSIPPRVMQAGLKFTF
jgi:Carboxypeptidase regulatory-like domain